ncbi:DUF975 family protein [Faecalimicrobium sp. JNUCC 81]
MICRAELKENTLRQLKDNWWRVILICLTYTIISELKNFDYALEQNINVVNIVFIIISGPFQLGFSKFILNFIEDRSSASFKDLFYGFTSIKIFIKSMVINFIIGFGAIIGMMLLIIPGIIWLLMFSQIYFILVENPKISIMECLIESCELMNGFKSELFILHLSFIGWAIVSLITFGIGFLWYVPYYEVTLGNFYVKLKEINENKYLDEY